MTDCAVETWTLPRESNEWVGPIVVTKTDAGTGLPVTDPVKFAVLAPGVRPPVPGSSPAAPWASPVLDPDGGTSIGVTAAPVSVPGTYGIWACVVGASEQPVLEPWQVGFIKRT